MTRVNENNPEHEHGYECYFTNYGDKMDTPQCGIYEKQHPESWQTWLDSVPQRPADDEAVESVAKGLVTGTLKSATPNLVGTLLARIRSMHVTMEAMCPKPPEAYAGTLTYEDRRR